MRNEIDIFNGGLMGRPTFMGNWDRLFDEFFGQTQRQPMMKAFAPTASIEETKDFYLISFDIPGVPKENVKIEIKDNTLSVSGERTSERKHKDAKTIVEERTSGKFYRAFTLPSDVDPERVEAHHEEGVLKIALHKVAEAYPRQVAITTEKKGVFA